LRFACPEHGLLEQDLYNHLAGKGCLACKELKVLKTLREPVVRQPAKIAAAKPHKVDEEALKSSIALAGKYNYLGMEVGTTDYNRVRLHCPKHGEFSQPIASHYKGGGCMACFREQHPAKISRDLPEFTQAARLIHGDKYEYLAVDLGGGLGSNAAALIICKVHGEFAQAKSDHLRGYGCAECSTGRSDTGNSLCEFVESLKLPTKREAYIDGTWLRLDIAIPSKNLGVELHGLYWHSSKFKSSSYHRDKHKLAADSGVRILHIFEDEWLNRRKAVESLIIQAVGIGTFERVFARCCTVSVVPTSVANSFFNLHHVQGATASSYYWGLDFAGKLLAVIGIAFRETCRGSQTSSETIEITRYATSCQVVGGFSKLLSAVLKQNPSTVKVVTFSDDRLFTGKMYASIGFKPVAKLRPDYFYVKNGRRVHKCKLQKSRIKSSGLVYQEGMTELQLTELNGYHRVYDCGKTRWELQI
jgi:hypothetical protein